VRKNKLDSRPDDPAASLHAVMAAVNPRAIGASAPVRPVQSLRPAAARSQASTVLFWTVPLVAGALALGGLAGPARAADDWKDDLTCEAAGRAVQSMSALQRQRFQQTGQTAQPCAGERLTPSDVPAGRRGESVHLQLFNAPGAATAGSHPHRAAGQRVSGAVATAMPQPLGAYTARPRAVALAPAVDAAARRHNIDPLLLHAIAHVESRHDPKARSRAGALGVMQVMPGTGQRFGVADRAALHDVPTNLDVSAAYLKTLQDRFGNNLPLVLAAYNAGEGAVERHGRRIPPYAETRRYVADVMATYERLGATARQLRGRAAPRDPASML
jgi:soluble lytic murein transglycosylase-like protein